MPTTRATRETLLRRSFSRPPSSASGGVRARARDFVIQQVSGAGDEGDGGDGGGGGTYRGAYRGALNLASLAREGASCRMVAGLHNRSVLFNRAEMQMQIGGTYLITAIALPNLSGLRKDCRRYRRLARWKRARRGKSETLLPSTMTTTMIVIDVSHVINDFQFRFRLLGLRMTYRVSFAHVL